MHLRNIFVSVIALAVLAAGCGGGGTTTAEPTTPGRTEFAAAADAICKGIQTTYTERLSALEKELSPGQKFSTAETNLKIAVPPLNAAVAELKELGAPIGVEQKVAAIVAALEDATKGLEAKPASELSGPKSPFAEFQQLTAAYGLQHCQQL